MFSTELQVLIKNNVKSSHAALLMKHY